MKTLPFLIAIAALSPLAAAQSERAADRRAAKNLFAKVDAHFNRGRYRDYFRNFAPSFYAIDTEGNRIGLADFRQGIMNALAGARNARVVSTVKNVQFADREMTVWVEQRLSARIRQGRKWSPMNSTIRFAYDLVPTSKGWAIGSARQLFTNEPWSFKTND